MRFETPLYWSNVTLPELNENERLNRVGRGDSYLEGIQVQDVDIDSERTTIKFRVCLDVSNVRLVSTSGKDKGTVVLNPSASKKGPGPRFEGTILIVFDDTNRWRVAESKVKLEDGKVIRC